MMNFFLLCKEPWHCYRAPGCSNTRHLASPSLGFLFRAGSFARAPLDIGANGCDFDQAHAFALAWQLHILRSENSCIYQHVGLRSAEAEALNATGADIFGVGSLSVSDVRRCRHIRGYTNDTNIVYFDIPCETGVKARAATEGVQDAAARLGQHGGAQRSQHTRD
jgi:hypothetical protein